MQNCSENIESLVRKFPTASLEELDAMKLLERFDTKYVVRLALLPEIMEHFLSDYKILEISGIREFNYYNEYFDTDDFRFYLDHHNGKINRLKIRYRRYVDTGAAFLEIKRKIKNETRKMRIPQSFDSYNFDASGEKFIDENCDVRAEDITPVLEIKYLRITLINPATLDKITIDRNLIFNNGENEYSLKNIALIEIKTKKQESPAYPIRVLKKMLIRRVSISKYCMGLVLTNTKVKHNRFKKNLLLINRLIEDKNGL